MTWTMPAEFAPQERIWMAFPRVGNTLGDDAASADEARDTWAAVANAAAGFEPVTMVVDPSAVAEARARLSNEVEVVEAPLDDYWMRDIGPTFVLDEGGGLGAVDWTFNGWGANAWATWERDDRIASTVAGLAGATHLPSPLVNEGGGIHVDGEGTVLLTETVQLDPRRNPYANKQRVEWELQRTIGATSFIWLPRGLTRDYESAGTRGHVDMVATFAAPAGCCCTGRTIPRTPTIRSCARCAPFSSRRGMPRAAASRSSSFPRPTRCATTTASSIGTTPTTWSSTAE
jgi:agmatine deiminase